MRVKTLILSLIALLVVSIGVGIFLSYTSFDDNKFNHIASGIQSIVVAAGLIVGGIWTLYTFSALGVVSRALAERTEIERRSREEPVLALDLKTAPAAAPGKNERLVTIATTFRNDGKRMLNVQFGQSTLLISKLVVDRKGVSTEGQVTKGTPTMLTEEGLVEVPERLLRAGQSRDIPFVVKVSSPGLYLIQVTANYTGVEDKDGELVASSDVPIRAFTQMITEIQ